MRRHKQNWLDIFSAFRVAFDARKILLGALGIYVTALILLGVLISIDKWRPGSRVVAMQLLQHPVQTSGMLLRSVPQSVFADGIPAFEMRDYAVAGVAVILMLFVWSFFGGAMARIAAVDFAKGERPRLSEAVGFASAKFGSFFWSLIVPLIFVAIFLLCNAFLGFVGRIPTAGPIIVGILLALAMLSSFLALLLLIGTTFGSIFMWPTIAMEGTDTFDAISRSFNYLFAKPWKTLWCCLMALLHGIVVVGFVALFAVVMLKLTLASVSWGMGEKYEPIRAFLSAGVVNRSDWPMMIGLILIKVVVILTWGLVLGFLASYKISAFTIIYAVLRKDVDGTDMNEIFLPEPDEPQLQTATAASPAAPETPGTPSKES